MTDLVIAQEVGKRFGGVQALSEVTFTIRTGEIYGLIGPNGAGKTTLFDLITRYTRLSSGDVRFEGRSIIDPEVIRMLLFGLAMVVMMLFRPAGLMPSAVRKRELAAPKEIP